MKRDKKLWMLILRERSSGINSPELRDYSEAQIVYNSALLVRGGYVDGRVRENASGMASSVVMLQMTNEGHDLLEALEAENAIPTPSQPMSSKQPHRLSVFVSHSAQDEKLASDLITLLRSSLNIPASEIRCTSVDGYRLPIGADTEEQLRVEVQNAKAFIGLITPSSISSAFVMFELGARWGAKLHLAPLLGAGAGVECLRGPLSSLNALHCENGSQVHQLISDLAELLDIQEPSNPAVYQSLIDGLIETSKAGKLSTNPKTLRQPLKTLPIEVTDTEIKILQLIAKVDRKGLLLESISEHFNLHPLKAERLLDILVKRELLYHALRLGFPGYYSLTTQGRDYLIENNLL